MNQNMLEASSLSTLDKMMLFDAGSRKENLRACKDSKLWDFRDTCIRNDLNTALYQIETEMIARNLLTVRTSPIIAHNVAKSNNVTSNNQFTSLSFEYDRQSITPADIWFITENINKADWDQIFRKSVLDPISDDLRKTDNSLTATVNTTITYIVTLIILEKPVEANMLKNLLISKMSWQNTDLQMILNRIIADLSIVATFEYLINEWVDSQQKTLNSSLNYSILTEKIEKHDRLNPKLWNEGGTLKKEVHDKIIEITNEFIDWLKEDGIKFNLKDIRIVGSNCSYNYTEDSDLDVHLIADASTLNCPDDLYPLLYSSYRSLFNKNLNIDFYGIPVEIYVEVE